MRWHANAVAPICDFFCMVEQGCECFTLAACSPLGHFLLCQCRRTYVLSSDQPPPKSTGPNWLAHLCIWEPASFDVVSRSGGWQVLIVLLVSVKCTYNHATHACAVLACLTSPWAAANVKVRYDAYTTGMARYQNHLYICLL